LRSSFAGPADLTAVLTAGVVAVHGRSGPSMRPASAERIAPAVNPHSVNVGVSA
jgi:hypothetical protein